MTVHMELINEIDAFHNASSHAQAMAHLYKVRMLVAEKPLDLILSLDQKLNQMEKSISTEADKDILRHAGYSFPEDLDKPKEFL